ncbi:proline-rich early nodulin-like protein [Diaporthe amygdali]|uniref:proline-rich early nodulin-like protein n=1 Tax=Phomopsis amygdali TaxID=1214568 RepID=UPI0022FEB31E|nr:proline-rich early nodulin-like protein [Diaporthe amygdali]KAJ0117055.1 proline-rich early nodulin-like protein [Diaporthe amygdali]
MTPRTRSQRVAEEDNVSAHGQAKPNGDSAVTNKRPMKNGPTCDKDKDEIVAEIEVGTRASSRRRVPSKRAQVTFSPSTSSKTPALKKPKTSTKKWTPEYVTQNKQSPLANKDLRALLLHPGAWDVLDDEDKKEVLALFPDTRHILNANTPDARPNIMSLQNDNNFRHDTEEYVSNLKAGMHDPVWLRDAWAAHEARAAGQFDEYCIRRLEVDWKTTIPDELKPEHLRPAPPTESKQEAKGEPQTEGLASTNGLAKDGEAADAAQADRAHVAIVANGSIKLDEANGSQVTEIHADTNGDVDIQDVAMASSADESAETVTNDFQKVSVDNILAKVNSNPEQMDTAQSVD